MWVDMSLTEEAEYALKAVLFAGYIMKMYTTRIMVSAHMLTTLTIPIYGDRAGTLLAFSPMGLPQMQSCFQ